MRVVTRILAVAMLSVAFTACRGSRERTFIASLRCGMTREEVTALARDRGYDSSDPDWLNRAVRNEQSKKKELTLLDLTFRNGTLVAYREGSYDPGTKKVAWRTVDLCTPPR